jgi:hypothetical protein
MNNRKLIFSAVVALVLLASACQSKKSGCPGSFHQKASKNIETKHNV